MRKVGNAESGQEALSCLNNMRVLFFAIYDLFLGQDDLGDLGDVGIGDSAMGTGTWGMRDKFKFY